MVVVVLKAEAVTFSVVEEEVVVIQRATVRTAGKSSLGLKFSKHKSSLLLRQFLGLELQFLDFPIFVDYHHSRFEFIWQ